MYYDDRHQAQEDLDHLCEIAAKVQLFRNSVASIAAVMRHPIDLDDFDNMLTDMMTDVTASASRAINDAMDGYDTAQRMSDLADFHARIL